MIQALFLFGVFGVLAVSPSEPPELTAALAKARETRLAHGRPWLRLGHWRRTAFGWRSEADGPLFFLAKDGKRDPAAELEATLRAFFAPPPPAPAKPDPLKRHAACRFPARFLLLARELGLPPALAQQDCPELVDFAARTSPRAVILVFSAYYLNNPASAFGHTFLRLRTGGTDLLDYGVDFSADVDTPNALLYAFRGLTGLFPGTFKRTPYFYKVREYNDYESRDLWEYELNLSPEARAMLIAHAWELGFTYFDYYYVTENCSYQILALLEAAEPSLDLVDRLSWPVIPADTVKALLANHRIVRRVGFRPSIRAQFRARLERLAPAERPAVRELLANADAPLPAGWSVEARARTLDAALDLVDVRHARALVDKSDDRVPVLKQRLLERRAAMGVVSPPLTFAPPGRKRPERGHGSARVGTHLGLDRTGTAFQSLDARIALHDLTDPVDGYPELAQIEFAATRLRWHLAPDRRPELEDLALVRVVSMTPFDRYDLQPSWKVSFGVQTRTRDCAGCLAGRILFGAGGAVALGRHLSLFATADIEALYGPRAGWDFPLRAGAGPAAGLLARLGSLALLATGDVLYYPRQSPERLWRAQGVLRWGFHRDHALSLEGSLERHDAHARIGASIYF